jgi:hypothetical protein
MRDDGEMSAKHRQENIAVILRVPAVTSVPR